MPLSSMKVQPIGSHEEPLPAPPPRPTPVVKSRLRRLFRIGGGGGGGVDESVSTAVACADHHNSNNNNNNCCFEPSSVCLAKMVQNFIEESDRQSSSSAVKCGRNRCNCFNGGSDGSDGESDGMDAVDLLKSLVVCESVAERNVLADTAKMVDKNGKACKRKDDLRKAVVESLVGLGYDASLCRSKWDKSPAFPAGEYEYVDVILIGSGERLIVDVDFRSEFEIARSTKLYKSILHTLPTVFVGKPDRLKRIIAVASEAMRQSLKKKGMHFPPWRKPEYFEAKWLSTPPARLLPPVADVAGEKKSESTGNGEDDEEEEEVATENSSESAASSSPPPPVVAAEAEEGDNNNPLFAMSESSDGEEEEEETAVDIISRF